MLKVVFFTLLCCFVLPFRAQQLPAPSKKLKAYIDNKQFYAPGVGHYTEVYIEIVGHTVQFVAAEKGLKGTLLIEAEVQDSLRKTVFSDHYTLDSPISLDSSQNNFTEVLRIPMPPGIYQLHLSLTDLNRDGSIISGSFPIVIKELDRKLALSDIEFIEFAMPSTQEDRFVKSGYYMIPSISNYLSEQIDILPFYAEVYNTTNDLILKYDIINSSSGELLSAFSKMDYQEKELVIPILNQIPIENLGSGSYQLRITAQDMLTKDSVVQYFDFERSKELENAFDISSMVLDPSFQTSIPPDSISFYLESLIPISKSAEIKTLVEVLKSNNPELMRRHLQAFWFQTSGTKAYESWLQYKAQVQAVEKLYRTNFMKGYQTDRGRVYLKYGAPSSYVSRESSPTEYPYEIWTYNKIGVYSNKRFVFYNPDLVNNNYRLLHSEMVGEIKNPGWQLVLSKRNTVNGTVDDPNMMNVKHWGGDSNDLFRQY